MTTKYEPLPSCCEFHGMEDGCCQGKFCPARRTMSDDELRSIGHRIASGVARLLAAPLRPFLPARLSAAPARLPRSADTTTS